MHRRDVVSFFGGVKPSRLCMPGPMVLPIIELPMVCPSPVPDSDDPAPVAAKPEIGPNKDQGLLTEELFFFGESLGEGGCKNSRCEQTTYRLFLIMH